MPSAKLTILFVFKGVERHTWRDAYKEEETGRDITSHWLTVSFFCCVFPCFLVKPKHIHMTFYWSSPSFLRRQLRLCTQKLPLNPAKWHLPEISWQYSGVGQGEHLTQQFFHQKSNSVEIYFNCHPHSNWMLNDNYTLQLSSHVHSFVVIWWPAMEFQQKEIYVKAELHVKNL